MEKQAFDVAIIGLGPVGCAAAIQFATAGLRVAAIERDPVVYQLPRAVMMDGEILGDEAELLRAIADTIGCPIPPFVRA